MSADRGQRAVAAAEEAAFGGTDLDTAIERRTLERRVREVVDGPWWRAAGPPVRVVTPRRSARSSSARQSGQRVVELRLTDEQLTLSTAAHELAHALAGVAEGHGPRFRSAYVDVISLLAGRTAAAALAGALAQFGVAPGGRTWPAPYRAEGATFVVVP